MYVRKLSSKELEAIPWDTLCVDLIGKYQFIFKREGKKFQIIPKTGEKKYKMTTKSGRSFYMQAITMIDPATCWIEIYDVPSAQANLVAHQVELVWLTHFPLSNKVIVDPR